MVCELVRERRVLGTGVRVFGLAADDLVDGHLEPQPMKATPALCAHQLVKQAEERFHRVGGYLSGVLDEATTSHLDGASRRLLQPFQNDASIAISRKSGVWAQPRLPWDSPDHDA